MMEGSGSSTPFRQLFAVVQAFLADAGRETGLQDLQVLVRKSMPDLLHPLNFPGRSDVDAQKIKSGSFTYRGRSIPIAANIQEEILRLAQDLEMNESYCLEIWAAVSDPNERRSLEKETGVAVGSLEDIRAAAREFHFHERQCLLSAVCELFKARLDFDMCAAKRRLIVSVTDKMLVDGAAVNLMSTVRQTVEKLQSSDLLTKPGAATPQSTALWSFRERCLHKLSDILFFMYYQTQIEEKEVLELIGCLQVCGKHFSQLRDKHHASRNVSHAYLGTSHTPAGSARGLDASGSSLPSLYRCLLSLELTLVCALDQEHHLHNRQSSSPNAFGVGNALSEGASGFGSGADRDGSSQSVRKSMESIHSKLFGETWAHEASRAMCLLAWALFLKRAGRTLPSGTDMGARVQITRECGSVLAKAYQLGCFHSLSCGSLPFLGLEKSEMSPFYVSVVEELVSSTLIHFKSSLPQSKVQQKGAGQASVSPGAETEDCREDVVQVVVHLCQLQPNFAQNFWHDRKNSPLYPLHEFLLGVMELATKNVHNHVPYVALMDLLAAFARGSGCAEAVYNFVKQAPKGFNWDHFFRVLRDYQAEMRGPPQPQEREDLRFLDGLGLDPNPALASGPAAEGALDRQHSMRPAEVEGLSAVLSLVRGVVRVPSLRLLFAQNREWTAVSSLAGLLQCPVPSALKGALMDTLAVFALSPTIAAHVWLLLEDIQILPTAMQQQQQHGATDAARIQDRGALRVDRPESALAGAPAASVTAGAFAKSGIVYELEQMESLAKTYPATRGFTHLVHSLLRAERPPEDLGEGYRVPGVMPFFEFLRDHVFLKFDHRYYQKGLEGERWLVAEAVLSFFCTVLEQYSLGGAAAGAAEQHMSGREEDRSGSEQSNSALSLGGKDQASEDWLEDFQDKWVEVPGAGGGFRPRPKSLPFELMRSLLSDSLLLRKVLSILSADAGGVDKLRGYYLEQRMKLFDDVCGRRRNHREDRRRDRSADAVGQSSNVLGGGEAGEVSAATVSAWGGHSLQAPAFARARERCVSLCLRLLEAVLERDEPFVAAAREFLPSVQVEPLHRLLLRYRDGLVHCARYVEYPFHSGIALRSTRLLCCLSGRLAPLELVETFQDAEADAQVVAGYVDKLLSGETLDPLDQAGAEEDEDELDAAQGWAAGASRGEERGGEAQNLSEGGVSEGEGGLGPRAERRQSLRMAIVNMLLDNLDAPAPNLSHLLLGLVRPLHSAGGAASASSSSARNPSLLQAPRSGAPSCLSAVLQLLAQPDFAVEHPLLAERCHELVYRLCSDRRSSKTVLAYLRRPQLDFHLLQLFELTMRAPALRRLEAAQALSAQAQVSHRNISAWVLKGVAVELHVTATVHPPQWGRTRRLASFLLNQRLKGQEGLDQVYDSAMDAMQAQLGADSQDASPLLVLLGAETGLRLPAAAPPSSAAAQMATHCLQQRQVGSHGYFQVQPRAYHQLLLRTLRGRAGAGPGRGGRGGELASGFGALSLGGGGGAAGATAAAGAAAAAASGPERAVEQALRWAIQWNQQAELAAAKRHAFGAWRVMLEVLLLECLPVLQRRGGSAVGSGGKRQKGDDRAAGTAGATELFSFTGARREYLFQLLSHLLLQLRVVAEGSASMAGELPHAMATAALSVVVKLREVSELAPRAFPSIRSCHTLLQSLLDTLRAFTRSAQGAQGAGGLAAAGGGASKTRGLLYSSLLHYLRLCDTYCQYLARHAPPASSPSSSSSSSFSSSSTSFSQSGGGGTGAGDGGQHRRRKSYVGRAEAEGSSQSALVAASDPGGAGELPWGRGEVAELVAGNEELLANTGDWLPEAVAQDAATGPRDAWSSVAAALLESLVAHGGSHVLHLLAHRGHLQHALDVFRRAAVARVELEAAAGRAEAARADAEVALGLVDAQFDAVMSLLLRMAQREEGAALLVDYQVMRKIAESGAVPQRPAEAAAHHGRPWGGFAASSGLSAGRPSAGNSGAGAPPLSAAWAMDRFRALFLPAVRLGAALLSTLPRNIQLADQVLAFLAAQGKAVVAILKDREGSLQGLTEVAEVMQLLARLAPFSELFVLRLAERADKIDRLAVQLLWRYGVEPLPSARSLLAGGHASRGAEALAAERRGSYTAAAAASASPPAFPLLAGPEAAEWAGAELTWWRQRQPATDHERDCHAADVPQALRPLTLRDLPWSQFDATKLSTGWRLLAACLSFCRARMEHRELSQAAESEAERFLAGQAGGEYPDIHALLAPPGENVAEDAQSATLTNDAMLNDSLENLVVCIERCCAALTAVTLELDVDPERLNDMVSSASSAAERVLGGVFDPTTLISAAAGPEGFAAPSEAEQLQSLLYMVEVELALFLEHTRYFRRLQAGSPRGLWVLGERVRVALEPLENFDFLHVGARYLREVA